MNKTTYSINITQTDDMGQNPSSLSMTTSDKEDLLRLLSNAGITSDSAEEKWSDDPADQGVCPVCQQKPCACDSVDEEYENTPKAEVVSTPGGNEYGEQRSQADQRQVTARQGDNPIKKEEMEKIASSLEESYLREWAEFQKVDEVSEDKVEEEPNEGNEFTGAMAKAKAAGAKEFKVDGKTYQVKEGKKPDFLDLDKDGDKEEPMADAADDKEEVKESSAELDYLKAMLAYQPYGAKPTEVTENMINQSSGNSELDWLKSVVKYQPK